MRQKQSHESVPDETSPTRSTASDDKTNGPKQHVSDVQGESELQTLATMQDPLPNRSAQDVQETIPDPSQQGDIGNEHITAHSSPTCKVRLFRSLFRGRDDVYAHGFVSKKTGKIGYAPAAWNEWTQLADGRRIPTPPERRRCKPLTDQALLDHFTKRDDRFTNVVGLYPMSKDSKVWFLAIDFDDDGWMREISAVRRVCEQHGLRPAVERSRSGDGGHLWLFFAEQVDAAQARRMGSLLLTQASDLTHIAFRSYDRMFPNQDTMPAGGFGNLIALPLQRKARDNGNSVFVDDQFKPYKDQWSFLSSAQRVTLEQVNAITALASRYNGPLGKLINPITETADTSNITSAINTTTAQTDKHEARSKSNSPRTGHFRSGNTITSFDVPETIDIIERNMLVIPKTGMTAVALNAIRRLAAFANPDFYRAQAMRQPVYNKPRIIYRGEETEDTILLPRGCKEPLTSLLSSAGASVAYLDKRSVGTPIRVKFTGALRPQQSTAARSLLACDNGILVAPTGFGKTVIAANLIAERKTSTLIVLRSSALLDQWKEQLGQFLSIDMSLPPKLTKTGRISRKQPSIIGQIGAGRNEANGIIDIALAQSLFERSDIPGEKHVKELVNHYGMVIFDECHHVASVDTETIARATTAQYVYGLTGTFKRDDGMQPITIMQCGPIRYTVDVKDQMASQRFVRRFIPRFTAVNLDLIEPFTYHDYLQVACDSKPRNDMILDDTMTVIQAGRTPLILTKRIEHARALADDLRHRGCQHVILLYGADPKSIRQEKLQQVTHIPPDESLAVVATGSYIGEGFDQKRLDTLMLAAPVSVETAVTQYIGRLHRDNNGKQEVRIYDYIDVTVPMSSTMYRKRLKTYLSQGYEPLLADELSNSMLRQAKTDALLYRTKTLISDDNTRPDAQNDIVTANDFLSTFSNDIMHCSQSITINASYLSQRGITQFDNAIMQAINRGVVVTITVRQPDTATETSRARTQRNITRLRALGCQVHTVESCNEFTIFDDTLIWFGTIEPLGNAKPDDCSLRFHDPALARRFKEAQDNQDNDK
ncbi:TOTE conflict system archaeo-eukaryotic primase domain-containing protein [Bifidobacterium biavatii]|uniref:TOTE conflict system archaeo-eukaryotic primase domain-containing protein n=1 Tax=Bifidobacterium biavatii TaxID=762212 RepID=UPI003B8315E8